MYSLVTGLVISLLGAVWFAWRGFFYMATMDVFLALVFTVSILVTLSDKDP